MKLPERGLVTTELLLEDLSLGREGEFRESRFSRPKFGVKRVPNSGSLARSAALSLFLRLCLLWQLPQVVLSPSSSTLSLPLSSSLSWPSRLLSLKCSWSQKLEEKPPSPSHREDEGGKHVECPAQSSRYVFLFPPSLLLDNSGQSRKWDRKANCLKENCRSLKTRLYWDFSG